MTSDLRRDLLEYCDRVPPSVNNGSFNIAVQFEADVVAAKKLARKANATDAELRAAINKLHGYWQ